MTELTKIYTSDFLYDLPEDKIAYFPANKRSDSKLLVLKNNKISETLFSNLSNLIDNNSFFVLNDTKVVPARLIFKKNTGATIEIFCLEPYQPSDYHNSLKSKEETAWRCLIGNKKRWKGQILELIKDNVTLTTEFVKDESTYSIVKFRWNMGLRFSEILEKFGKIPLPPYIRREAQKDDLLNYQTIYAINEGSVAAPTAGLHFTPDLFEKLKSKDIDIEYLTLHVGHGTFKPVTATMVLQHKMHHEWISISKKTIANLLKNIDKSIIAVGTTSVRSLESIYWFGVNIINNKESDNFNISQWMPYNNDIENNFSREKILYEILNYMDKNNLENIAGTTELMIIPSYKFRMVDVMITNFHQPGSTLLMLVSAFVGDVWKDAYNYALKNNFRFLSYGDACLFFPDKNNVYF